jgi:hypothetical protein
MFMPAEYITKYNRYYNATFRTCAFRMDLTLLTYCGMQKTGTVSKSFFC